jgi:phospholipid transport system transporter-binding protein
MNPASTGGPRTARGVRANRFANSAIAGTARRAAARAVTAPAKPAPACVALPASCVLEQAAALKATLMSLRDVPEQVTLNVEAIAQIDTAALQLLTAFAGELRRGGRDLRWQGTNQVLRDAAQQLGLVQALGLPV